MEVEVRSNPEVRGATEEAFAWPALTAFLVSVADSVVLSFDDVERIMRQDLPASARKHRPFWSNGEGNAYARHWLRAGFKTSTRGAAPGRIRFQRTGPSLATGTEPPGTGPTNKVGHRVGPAVTGSANIVLLGCVKKKRASPSPAADLYVLALWTKRRRYADVRGVPWYILSAQHGLVDPDELLEPYDRSMKDLSPAQRAQWARAVATELTSKPGDLHGAIIEIHAGMDYQRPLRPLLADLGATVVYPLEGLTQGEQLQWYNQPTHR